MTMALATTDKQVSPFMSWLLNSPLHSLLSNQIMLITVTGKATGTRYTLPVNYVCDSDDLVISSRADRRWWRNLRGGASVELLLQRVMDTLLRSPALAKGLSIKLRDDGQEQTPVQRVLIRIGCLEPLSVEAEQHQGR
jgi:hypothetical protein